MKIIDLCGTWKIRGSSGERGGWKDWPAEQPYLPTYDAPVPGTVQQALEAYTGNVLYAHNAYNARFIEEQHWHYNRCFTLSEEDCTRSLRLVFEGLDLTADIYVNGVSVGTHNNYYTSCRLDITPYVHPGENQLGVTLESGLFWASDKPVGNLFCAGTAHPLTKRMWLRKPQSTFEWDWSPRLINVGIFKPCRIEISDGIFPSETKLFARLSEDFHTGDLDLTQYLHCAVPDSSYTVTVNIPEADICTQVSGIAVLGENVVSVPIRVPQPKLWYPLGYGDQFLYTVQITVCCGSSTFSVEKQTGFRRAEIDQSPHPVTGNYFIIRINGIPVFAKGGNLVPVDLLCSRFTPDVYETLIQRALEANFNALRVWGGGLYENDVFYELCDRYGLLVWQDFINACASYPAFDKEFFLNIEAEYRHNIRRLSPHPSLVIYAGNNEIDWMMQMHGKKPQHLAYPDALLYYRTIPQMLKQEGDDRYYQPSSPYSPDGIDDNCAFVGDQHPWGVGIQNVNYFDYRKREGRFPNEGGVLGPTSLPNMMACFGPGQDFVHSFDWHVHDNSCCDRNGQSADRYTEFWLQRSPKDMTIPEYIYYGGFCQGEGLTEYILNFRRRMFDSGAAIFWMFNDCWPATRSWTIVDYLRNRTPSFHPVRRAFAPVTVEIVKEDSGYGIYVINDKLSQPEASLEYGGFSPDGTYVTHTLQFLLTPNASTRVAHLAPLPDGFIPYAILTVSGEPVARRRLVEQPYYQLGLPNPTIHIHKENGFATYTSDTPVFGVCLDLSGKDGGPSDNFFDLFPGKPYTVHLGNCSGDILFCYPEQTCVCS